MAKNRTLGFGAALANEPRATKSVRISESFIRWCRLFFCSDSVNFEKVQLGTIAPCSANRAWMSVIGTSLGVVVGFVARVGVRYATSSDYSVTLIPGV